MSPRLALAVLASLVAASPASAQSGFNYNEPLPLSSVNPADGATIEPCNGVDVPWEVAGSVKSGRTMSVSVEVTTQNEQGQDGTLADDYKVDFFVLYESDAFPGTYRGASNSNNANWWCNVPGTYYWQASTFWVDNSKYPGTGHSYKSPVYTIVVQNPTPPPAAPAVESQRLNIAAAKATIPSIIRDEVGRSARRLRATCSRDDEYTANCRSRWRDAKAFYDGIFDFELKADGLYYGFSGVRASRACLRRSSVKRCSRSVRW